MIVKVNRVNSVDEILKLKSAGVDIIGISLKLSDKYFDSRALNIEEIQTLKEKVDIPNLSLNLNILEYNKEDIIRASKTIKPNSLNLFIEASSLASLDNLSELHLQSIKAINQSGVDIISFGNGVSYDGPSSIPNTLGVYKNLKFIEVNIDTLSAKSFSKIKTRKEWADFLKINEYQVKQENCDTILESFIESMKTRPYLVDDRNIDDVSIEKIIEIGAKGVTLSIDSILEDEYAKGMPSSNNIATMFEFDKILEITKKMKRYDRLPSGY